MIFFMNKIIIFGAHIQEQVEYNDLMYTEHSHAKWQNKSFVPIVTTTRWTLIIIISNYHTNGVGIGTGRGLTGSSEGEG